MAEIDALAALRRLADMSRGATLIAGLSPKQREFFDDPAKVKAGLGGRRAGKTWMDVVGLYDAARRFDGVLVPYIGLSAVSARRILWPILTEVNTKARLGMKLDEHRLIAKLPENGSEIFLVGGDEKPKIEALRGPKYPRAVVDECGSFPKALLRYLCEDVLQPALMDMNGDLWLTGSPNAACAGYFHDVTTGAKANDKDDPIPKISTHHWTVLDNPYIPHAAAWLENLKRERGWTDETPRFRREYLAHWVRDELSLVFRFDRARHLISPEQFARLAADIVAGAIGIDLGTSAVVKSMAFVVNLWAKANRTVYTPFASKHAGMNALDAGDQLWKLAGRFPKVRTARVDEGGLGKGYSDLWRKRAQAEWEREQRRFPGIVAADKRDKMAHVELMNAELDRGRLLIVDCPETLPLVEEIELLQWNDERDDFDPRFEDHATDGWLYGWRDCYAYNEKLPAEEPTAEQKMVRAAERAWKQRQRPWYAR